MNNQEHYKLKYLKYMFKYNELLHSTNFMEGGVNDGEVNDDVNNGEVNGDDNKTDPVEEQVVKDTAVAEEQVVAEEQAVEEKPIKCLVSLTSHGNGEKRKYILLIGPL